MPVRFAKLNGAEGVLVPIPTFPSPVIRTLSFSWLVADGLVKKKIADPAELAVAPVFAEPAVGMGKDLRIQARGLVGAGLWVDVRYVHLAAFRTGGNGGNFTTRLSRPSRRHMGEEDVIY